MQFKTKNKAAAREPKGKAFLTEAKGEHVQLFHHYLTQQEEFDTPEEFLDALEEDAWKLTEQVVKQSYRNGIARGKSV